MGVAYFRYGEMLEKLSATREALRYYQKATDVEEALAKADPKDLDQRLDYADDLMKVSEVQLKLGNATAALIGYREALAICEGLSAANPDNADWRAEVGLLYEQLGRYHALQARRTASRKQSPESWREAKRWYQQSLEVWQSLNQHKTLAVEYANKPSDVSRQVSQCDAAIAQFH